jgi:hypothetical protein
MNRLRKKIKVALIMGTMTAFTTACSDDHDDITVPSSALKIAFVQTNTGHIENNLQVGDVLTYKYTLEDIDGEFSSYEIVPEGQTVVFHQIKDTDFSLGDANIKPIGKEGNFKLTILKPGNFQLKFVLKKITSEGEKTAVATAEVDFNAVKITAYRYDWEYKGSSGGHHSQHLYFHKLYIDTGHEQYDNLYLGGLTLTAYFKNLKNLYQGFQNTFQDFIPNTHIDFYEQQDYEGTESGSKNVVLVSTIDEIVFDKDVNGVTTHMEYKNIPVIDWKYQNSWADQGDPALH